MTLLQIDCIHKSIGDNPVLKGVSFSLEKGEVCAVIGASGEGKTTLLRCINLLTAIDHGEIRLNDETLIRAGRELANAWIGMDPALVRRKVGLVFQEWNLWPNLTIRDNIALAPILILGLSKKDAAVLAEDVATRVRIADKLDSFPHSLSGGQKQRAAIARALAMNPDILMLDEVTSALDPVLAAEVLDVILELKEDGRTLLLVTHHIHFARAAAGKIVFLHDGKVHEYGSAEILDEPSSTELKWFLRQVRRSN